MGFSAQANLVVGVSLARIFTGLDEKSNSFDEFDKYGNKTGKIFKEEILLATLPNGNEVVLASSRDRYGWNYDLYESLGFDGGSYIGDKLAIDVEIHHGDYETKDLSQIIVGLTVCETESSSNIDNKLVQKVDEDLTNEAIARTRKQLAELFGYTGEINLYLINSLSY